MTICKESKHVEKRPGPARTGVYVILDDQTGKIAGKIIYAYPADGAGMLYASLWDWSNPGIGYRNIQHGRAGGYGYDKCSECLDGMVFGTGDREFTIDAPGNGMSVVEQQFKDHGFTIMGLL